MKRDAQTAILEACARFLRRGLDPLIKRLDEMESKQLQVLNAKVLELEKGLSQRPEPVKGQDGAPGRDGKDCDMEAVKAMIAEAVKAIPVINGKDGVGLAGAMIDRDGNLVATLTNGELQNLGPVVGKDGKDGVDGIGLDSFEMEYIPEAHEISIKASAAGRVKELRYPAGGIRPGGYWRDGTRAKAAEAWIHDGSLWIATKDTSTKPETVGSDWIIAARKGRDGERGQKGQDGSPPAPIKLGS